MAQPTGQGSSLGLCGRVPGVPVAVALLERLDHTVEVGQPLQLGDVVPGRVRQPLCQTPQTNGRSKLGTYVQRSRDGNDIGKKTFKKCSKLRICHKHAETSDETYKLYYLNLA